MTTAPRHDPLGPLVRRLFSELPRAGVLAPDALPPGQRLLRGEAGREADGARVVFHIAASVDGRVTDVRFLAYGCPHTLAAAAWIASQLPGRSLANLIPDTPAEWAQALAVPVEKLGRLLTIEDALRALA